MPNLLARLICWVRGHRLALHVHWDLHGRDDRLYCSRCGKPLEEPKP